MNTSPFRSGFLTRLGVFIAICTTVGLSGCSSTVKLNYVNWEVQFNKGTSELDRAVAMDSVRRYILHYLSGQQYTGYILKKVNIDNTNLSDQDRAPIGCRTVFYKSWYAVGTTPTSSWNGSRIPRRSRVSERNSTYKSNSRPPII